jgi:hypothetical protein
VLHALPGRIRLRIDALKDDSPLVAAVEERLSRIEGIRNVVASAVTGSLLVEYEPIAARSSKFFEALVQEAERVIPALDVESLARAWLSGNGGRPEPAKPFARRVTEAAEAVSEGVGSVLGGIDLRFLVPLALFSFGFRSLVFDRPLPRPTWYDFLWFGFGTFVLLNPPAAERRE